MDKLIVRLPTFGHEIMAGLFQNLVATDSKGLSLFSYSTGHVRLGGSTDVELEDGIKSPDFSLYEQNSLNEEMGPPTVVWEVAYGEDERKLAHDLARFVACSRGYVQLAIGIKIERGKAKELKSVKYSFWEMDYTETFSSLKESCSSLNVLERCDEYAKESEDRVVPAATKFSCVSKMDGEFIKFVVSQRHVQTVSVLHRYTS